MTEDFRARLVQHAQTALDRAGRALTEAATNQYLVLPFFQLLGYDPLDPDEIIPEAHASFSEKFKNRVDFAICQGEEPVMAVEVKKVGALVDANRGELKGYFNAVPSVKLGILTDGITFQFYTDTGLENMMDDEPFVTIDLSEVAQERITDDALDALSRLRKGTFDPADVGADARRKIYMAAYVDVLEESFRTPGEAMVRTLMDLAQVEGRRTSRLLEEHTPIVSDAIQAFFDRKILERVGFANRQDLVRVSAQPVQAPAPDAPRPEPEEDGEVADDSGIVTTEMERQVFDYVRTRLPFLLAGDEDAFARLENVSAVDRKTVYTVFYRQERKGRLFNFWEAASSPRLRFDFAGGEQVQTDDLAAIDQPLLAAYRQRISELP